MSFDHWSFSVRDAYREGIAALGAGRRRAIRIAVLEGGPATFRNELLPALDRNVELERRSVRALTDLGMGLLVVEANAEAAAVLGEAAAAAAR